jgi:penicillin G amidase
MTQTDARLDLAGATPQLDGTVTVHGIHAPVTIVRDAHGVPHISATNEHDAWFGQGYAAAQDRLWQMEYDRRRATGRWAEAAGPSAVAGDRLARRLGLEWAARDDIDEMSDETRAMFEVYAAGVNAFLASGQPLPVEYELTGIAPEPWEPWHSVAAFKVRHVLMGVWQQKLTNARLLALIGPEAFARLDRRTPPGSSVILPPGGVYQRLTAEAAAEIHAAAESLGFLAEVEAGSNSWAVHGSRTTTGKPVLCNDSHRALDVPNVYWQVHVSCPEFNVIGATFPGMPGFPHFGHNDHVGWNITHTAADYQDLYIERFNGDDPPRYLTPEGWAETARTVEEIGVRGGEPVVMETWRTRHGPVVHGDPRTGWALALRYTATDRPCRAWETLRPMIAATTVDELFDSQALWVDPVNNMVAADTSGTIGYLTRGELPLRNTAIHRQFPAPGWTDEHEWTGRVPFERMPRAVNPPEGFIATANQAVVTEDDLYISHAYSPPSRAERIVELLSATERHDPAALAAMQGDTLSRPARAWGELLTRVGPFEGDAERARVLLAGWSGDLRPESGVALLYGCFRAAAGRALFEPVVGEAAWAWLTSGELPALGRMINAWLANANAAVADGAATAPDGRPWVEVLPAALATAWEWATAAGGPDASRWRWDAVHGTNAKHTLAATFPDLAPELNPLRTPVGGDGDTIQAASYEWREPPKFDITGLPVYRQVIDFNNVPAASFVVPGGVSGLPGTAHYVDQLELWRTHQRVPMHSTAADVAAHAATTLTLRPA